MGRACSPVSVSPLSCGLPAVEPAENPAAPPTYENDLSSPHSPDSQHRREYRTLCVRSLRHWYVQTPSITSLCTGSPTLLCSCSTAQASVFPCSRLSLHCLVGWCPSSRGRASSPKSIPTTSASIPSPSPRSQQHAIRWLLFLYSVRWRSAPARQLLIFVVCASPLLTRESRSVWASHSIVTARPAIGERNDVTTDHATNDHDHATTRLDS